MTFSNINRSERIETALSEKFDLVVIGGGITGAGILLDATLRGMKCLLVEKEDFASGTSSKSTKLIHGGLRYLKQLEIGLVRETGLERAVAHNNICHLVHPEKMLLPIVKNGTFSYLTGRVAIGVYDFLADVKSEDRCRGLTKRQVKKHEPLLDESLLKSGILYSEYRTDDARLTIEIIKSACRLGGTAFNYMKVVDFKYDDQENICSVRCEDIYSGETITFDSKYFVNATGPWVDKVRSSDDQQTVKNLHLAKGVHIVVNKERFPLRQAVYFDAFDGRMIFAIPRGTAVYIGTTDTTYEKDIDRPDCTKEDLDYLLDVTNQMFTIEPRLGKEDVSSHWSGLRPLIKGDSDKTSELSRKDEIFESDSGLISIAGGKLTGFRKMAKKVVDMVNERSDKHFGSCQTKNFKIHEQPFSDYEEYKSYIVEMVNTYNDKGLNKEIASYLASNYGKDSSEILSVAISMDNENLKESIILAELKHCIDHESVLHPIDFFERRTGRGFFDLESCEQYLNQVISLMKDSLEDKNSSWQNETKSWITEQSLADLKAMATV